MASKCAKCSEFERAMVPNEDQPVLGVKESSTQVIDEIPANSVSSDDAESGGGWCRRFPSLGIGSIRATAAR